MRRLITLRLLQTATGATLFATDVISRQIAADIPAPIVARYANTYTAHSVLALAAAVGQCVLLFVPPTSEGRRQLHIGLDVVFGFSMLVTSSVKVS